MEKKTPDDAQRPVLNDEEFAAKLQATTTNAAVRRADERERADRDHWWIDGNDVAAVAADAAESGTRHWSDARRSGRHLIRQHHRHEGDHRGHRRARWRGTAQRGAST